MAKNGRPTLAFPIILIVIGGFFLYANYRPGFDPWPILRTYWPLILIFVGLGKIWDSTQRQRQQAQFRNDPNVPRNYSVGSTIAILGLVLVFVALFWHGRVFSRDRHGDSSLHHMTQTVDRDDARSVNVSVESGAGEVNVTGGGDHLLDADFNYGYSFLEPKVDYKIESGVGQLTISQDNDGPHFATSHNNWNLRFSNKVPLSLKVEMGAGEGHFKLRDLQVTDLNLQMGAGHVDVDLTGERKSDLDADIEGGVGQATIRLPRNVGVVANASGGIGAISAHGFKRDGDDYVNDAYGKTPATIHLKVQGGVGQVSLLLEP
jgi:N-terminal domain of toast_rack, DUF2154/Domain of unknown function (DUF5668)